MGQNNKAINLRKKILEILLFFRDRFDLHEGKEDELETIDYIKKNVEFKGAILQENRQNTLLIAYAKFRQRPSQQEKSRFENWLKLRTKADSLALIVN
jgi:hypothetical protein